MHNTSDTIESSGTSRVAIPGGPHRGEGDPHLAFPPAPAGHDPQGREAGEPRALGGRRGQHDQKAALDRVKRSER